MSAPLKLIIVPGWNEANDDMRLFIDGRRGIPGLAAAGIDCRIFGSGTGGLWNRVDQFASFLDDVRAEGDARIGSFGYSAGGLVSRGFLRAYPDRARDVAGTFQLATPNAGVVTGDLGGVLRSLRISDDEVEDLDIESDFMRRLNGVSGHWVDEARGRKHWQLDGTPWVAPDGARLMNVAGRMTKYENRSDGLVLTESATLNGLVEHRFLDGAQANHLNLSGSWNLMTTVFRGWRCDDAHWPAVVGLVKSFFSEALRVGAA